MVSGTRWAMPPAHPDTSWHTWAHPHRGDSAKGTSRPPPAPAPPLSTLRTLTCPFCAEFPPQGEGGHSLVLLCLHGGARAGHGHTAAPPGDAAPGAGEGGHIPARSHSAFLLLLLLFLFFLLSSVSRARGTDPGFTEPRAVTVPSCLSRPRGVPKAPQRPPRHHQDPARVQPPATVAKNSPKLQDPLQGTAKPGITGAVPASCSQGSGPHWVIPQNSKGFSSQEEQQVPLSDWELMTGTVPAQNYTGLASPHLGMRLPHG